MGSEDFFADSPSDKALVNGVRMGQFAAAIKDEAFTAARTGWVADAGDSGSSMTAAFDARLDTRYDLRYAALTVSGKGVVRNDSLVINVRDYGATGNGSTDDSTALQNALNAVPFGGGVYLPRGDYRVNATLTVPDGVHLFADTTFTSINTTSTIGDVLRVGNACIVENLSIGSTVTRTSGAHIQVNGSGATIDKVTLGQFHVGIQLGATTTKVAGVRVSRIGLINMQAESGGIFLCNVAEPRIEGVTGVGPGPTGQPYYGIRVWEGDTWTLRDVNMVQCGRGLLIDTPAGKFTSAGRIIGGMFDSAGSYSGGNASCAEINPAGSVYDLNFHACWFGNSAAANGLYMYNSAGGTVHGVELNGCEFVHNGYAGLGVFGSTVKHWRVTGGIAAGNTSFGVSVGGASTEFSIMGLRAGTTAVHPGPQAYGVNLAAAAQTGYIIAHNNLRGNATAGLSDSTTGSPARITTPNLT